MKLHELYKRIDPKTDMLNSALAALHRRASSKGDLQSIDGYAFDIIRSYNIDIGAKELARLYREKHNIAEDEESVNEGYKLQLERDTDMMVLHIKDTATGKRTEVRGKPGYESGNYDPNDSLHILLDKVGKSANISELMNGEVVSINPNHPQGASAKKATTKAFNEAKDGLPVKTLKGLYHVGTMDSSKKRDGFEGAGLSVSTHPDAWKQIARGHVTGDTHSATKEGNKFLDAHSLSDAHNKQIIQWAIKNGYLEQQETVTVCYYDDEMEDNLCSTFDSMADAEAEYDEELEYMDVTVDKGGIVPTDKLKKETRQNRMDSTGVLEFVLPIFAEQQGLDGVWWQDNLDVQRYSAPRGVIVPSKIKSWKFTVNESINEVSKEEFDAIRNGEATVTEALDNPYPVRWSIQDDDEWEGKAKTEAGDSIQIMITQGYNNHKWEVDFYVGGSMQVTGKGDQFRVFATVVSAVKKWWAWLSKSKQPVEAISFSAFKGNKSAKGSAGRSNLYNRFATQFARSIGFTVSAVDSKDNIKFVLTNPKYKNQQTENFADGKNQINEVLDKPYSYSWVTIEDEYWQAEARTDSGANLEITFEYFSHEWELFFEIDGSHKATAAGDEFRIFATVVSAIKEWWKSTSSEGVPVKSIEFSADKLNNQTGKTGSREKLYNRFAQQFANSIGFNVQQGDTGNATNFKLVNPNYKSQQTENFADGKNPGRKGLAKRSGVNTKASVSDLRKTAKNSSGEKQRMAHWMANMKAGKAKKK